MAWTLERTIQRSNPDPKPGEAEVVGAYGFLSEYENPDVNTDDDTFVVQLVQGISGVSETIKVFANGVEIFSAPHATFTIGVPEVIRMYLEN